MTPKQFAALATLMRARPSTLRDAASLVLVDGLRIADAARQAGVKAPLLSQTVIRHRRALTLAKKASDER